ncbi:MAG: cytosine permease, partial [Rubrivivax sp.]|nr:cytosine permease [Rubrivivax sp.]
MWFGGVISVSALLVGATLIKGLTFWSVLLWGGLGFLLVGICMALLGARAAERNAGTGALAARAFGTQGASLVLGIVVGVPLMGWFGVQSAIAAESVVRIGTMSFNLHWSFVVVTLALGATMTLTAVIGFGALKWLNYVAVPCKVALVVYGVGRVLLEHGFAPILAWRPEPAHALDPLTAIGLAAGFVAVAAVIAPDYARQARTPRDAVLGCLLGLVPASIVLAGCGAVLAIAQNTHDIVEIYAGMGLPLLALTMLIVATWTT